MTRFPTAFIVLIVATAIAATGCSIPTLPEPQGARGPTYAPYPTFTREPTESEIEVQQAVALVEASDAEVQSLANKFVEEIHHPGPTILGYLLLGIILDTENNEMVDKFWGEADG